MTGAGAYPTLSGVGAERLRDSDVRVVVTGAGGWLGMASLEMLHGLLGEAFHRRVACFGAKRRTLRLRGGVEADQRPLAELAELPATPSIVLHLAFLTQEKANTMSSAAYAAANWAISLAVISALERIDARAVFLASSGAVYLADNAAAPASKRLYGALKLEDEARFAHWAEETGHPVAIARVFNLAGPYINKRASYALACFIADALAGRPVAIQAAHRVYRSYVAIEELMSVVISVLMTPTAGVVTFDTAGDAAPELAGVANVVCDCLRPNLKVRRPAVTNDAPDRYVGDGSRLRALGQEFGVRPVGFAEQIRQTADYMAAYPEPVDGAGERA